MYRRVAYIYCTMYNVNKEWSKENSNKGWMVVWLVGHFSILMFKSKT